MLSERLPFGVVSIHGAPRSGTSWLGQIFNSHSDVAYRFQPLFSYRFKGAISDRSSSAEIKGFLRDLYSVNDDEFILQTRQRQLGVHPGGFEKRSNPSVLVMKEVRYHQVIEALLREIEGIRVIGIVRHPCGVINSWLKTPREFSPEWNAITEWRSAPSKNAGRPEEYYGFEKWKELTHLFLRLEVERPDSFRLVTYEHLLANPIEETRNLLEFAGLKMTTDVKKFLMESHAREIDHPDTVFRTRDVGRRWKTELDFRIRDAILSELEHSPLKRFL
jgi:hypothetical protein